MPSGSPRTACSSASNGFSAAARATLCSQIEWIAFDPRALTWRIGECDALRDHALDIRGPRCGHEIARTLDAQAGITRETFFILRRARRKGEIGELMYDCLRRRGPDRARERIRIEHIDHDRLGAEGP